MNAISVEQLLKKAETAVTHNQFWQAVELYTAVLRHVPPHPDEPQKESRLIALRERGYLLSVLGEPIAALAAYEQYYLEAGSSKHAVEALIRIGNGKRALARYTDSITAYQEALTLAEALNYTVGRAFAFAGLGGVYWYLRRPEESLTNLKKAIALFEQLNHPVGQIQTLNQMGIVYGDKGQMDKAIAVFQNSMTLCRELGRTDTLVIALNNLGECYQFLFDLDKALQYHLEALALAEAGQLRRIEADLCRNIGVDWVGLGKAETAVPYLHRALHISQETNNQEIELQTLYALGMTELELGQVETAEKHALTLKKTAETANIRIHVAYALHVLGLCAWQRGDVYKSAECWQQAIFMAHEAEKSILLWRLHANLAEIATSPGLAQVHYRIAAEVIQQIAYPLEDKPLSQTFLNAPPIQNILQKAR